MPLTLTITAVTLISSKTYKTAIIITTQLQFLKQIERPLFCAGIEQERVKVNMKGRAVLWE